MGKFIGSFDHCLDQKNRLRLPAKLKSDLGSEAPIIMKGYGESIYIYPANMLDTIVDNITSRLAEIERQLRAEIGLSEQDREKLVKELKTQRICFANIRNIEEDNQGRFTLNQQLRAYAKIEKNVVFNGAGNRIELWSKEIWEDYTSGENGTGDTMLQVSVFGG